MKRICGAAAILALSFAINTPGWSAEVNVAGKWKIVEGKVSTNLVFVQKNDIAALILTCAKGYDSIAVMMGKRKEDGQDKFNDGLFLLNNDKELRVSIAVLPGEDNSVTGMTTLPLLLPVLSGEEAIKAAYGGDTFILKGKGRDAAVKAFSGKCVKS